MLLSEITLGHRYRVTQDEPSGASLDVGDIVEVVTIAGDRARVNFVSGRGRRPSLKQSYMGLEYDWYVYAEALERIDSIEYEGQDRTAPAKHFARDTYVVLPEGHRAVFAKVLDPNWGDGTARVALLDPDDNHRRKIELRHDELSDLPWTVAFPVSGDVRPLVSDPVDIGSDPINSDRVYVDSAADSDGEFPIYELDAHGDKTRCHYIRLNMFAAYERWARDARHGSPVAAAEPDEPTAIDTFALLGQLPSGN